MEKDLVTTMMNVARILKEKIHSSKCLIDFSPAEIEVLTFLRKNKNSTMKAVADYLHIKPPSVTSIIDCLAKKNTVKRTYKAKDRREIRLEITEKGIKRLQKKQEKVQKAIKKVFSPLNQKEQKILIKIFEKIHNENI